MHKQNMMPYHLFCQSGVNYIIFQKTIGIDLASPSLGFNNAAVLKLCLFQIRVCWLNNK